MKKNFCVFLFAFISLFAFGTNSLKTKSASYLKTEAKLQSNLLVFDNKSNSILANDRIGLEPEYHWFLYNDGCFYLTRVYASELLVWLEIVEPWEWAGSVKICIYEDVIDDMC
jgi:hypothetical protein